MYAALAYTDCSFIFSNNSLVIFGTETTAKAMNIMSAIRPVEVHMRTLNRLEHSFFYTTILYTDTLTKGGLGGNITVADGGGSNPHHIHPCMIFMWLEIRLKKLQHSREEENHQAHVHRYLSGISTQRRKQNFYINSRGKRWIIKGTRYVA